MTSPSEVHDALNEFVVYCCLCFKPVPRQSEARDFWATSCGHIICTSHIFPNGAPCVRKRGECLYCHASDVSITSLGSREIPIYLQGFLRPGEELITEFYTSLKFQISSLRRIANFYKQTLLVAEQNLDKKRQLLMKATDKLIEAEELERENGCLKEEIERLRNGKHGINQSNGQGQKRKSLHRAAGDPQSDNSRFNARQAMPPPEIQSNTLRLQQQWAVGTESTWSRNDAHDTAQHNYSAPEIEEQNAGSLYRQGNQHDFVYPQQGKEEAHFIRPRQYSVCDGIGYQHYNPPNGTGGLPLRSRHEKIHQPDISLIPPPTRGPSRGPLAPFHPPTFVRQNLNFPGRLDTPSSPSTFPPPRSATSHSTARPLTTPRRNGGLNSVSSPFFHEAAPSRPASVASHANAYSRGGGPMITIKPSRLFDRSGRGSASRDSHRHTDVNGSQ